MMRFLPAVIAISGISSTAKRSAACFRHSYTRDRDSAVLLPLPRSAEYVAETSKEAGYRVHFEEFEFPDVRSPRILMMRRHASRLRIRNWESFRVYTKSPSSVRIWWPVGFPPGLSSSMQSVNSLSCHGDGSGW